ncbi:hypothetical protein [Solirubrobacter soli]|uniref:hypothetical protein n=1 Tax=Solirubrobacter soli TaxID=363832 RepID=UPI0004259EB6|nr:hypothetical protein [Solirubrobacter soli]
MSGETGTTSIARLACTFALPRDADQGALRGRLDRVLEGRLGDELAAALVPLDETDPGAVWVVRQLRADAVVSAAEDDLDQLARQWGAQLARGIVETILAGPGGNVVRFPSRAAYVAAFAAALAEGRADSWVFGPLEGLRLLAPARALHAAAERSGVPVTEALAELARLRRVDAVLAASPSGHVAALWEACVAEAGPRSVAAELFERVVAAAPPIPADTTRVLTPAARAIRLFATVVPALGAGPEVVAAVARLIVAPSAALRAPRELPSEAADAFAASATSAQAVEEPPGEVSSRRRPTDAAASVFVAAGAPAFLVTPSLEAVGLADVAGPVRALVLARLLGRPVDAAIQLAAGDPLEPDVVDGPALIATVTAALAADDRLDGRWLEPITVTRPDGRVVALVRDPVTDTWLAGAVLAPGRRPPWPALLEAAAQPFADAPAIVSPELAAPECGTALARPRPPDDDVAWLAPGDDDELALGLAARAALRHLARRLPGFDRSSMGYLVERVLPPGGAVTVTDVAIRVELNPAPLGVVLVMAGLDTLAYRVPWLDRDVVVTHLSA